ncbi:sugar ABC transporter substrate-binding protein [Candidatus Acetothermia bacterium]|nr:MAG: sugar ABC transporter substrate-binding protein [Candidatus Acetothermia bacterium]
MRRFGLLVLTLGLLLAIALGGLAQEKVKIGVLGKCVHPYWDVVRIGVEAAAELFPDVEATFWVPQIEDIPAQISTVEAWLAAGYDALSLAPSDPKAMEAVIKKALGLGIPVITHDTDAPGSGRYFYLGTGNYAFGRAAGEAMLELLGGPEAAKGKKVIIITGSLTALNSLERMQGFRDVVEPAGVEVVEVLNDREDVSTAVSLVEAALSAYPDLAGIYGVYAASTTGLARALETAGKTEEIIGVGVDTIKEHLQFLQKGALDTVVGQRQYYMGYHSVTLMRIAVKYGIETVLAALATAGALQPQGLDKEAILSYLSPVFPDEVVETIGMLLDTGIVVRVGGAPDGAMFLDTGSDVVTRENLEEMFKTWEEMGLPMELFR